MRWLATFCLGRSRWSLGERASIRDMGRPLALKASPSCRHAMLSILSVLLVGTAALAQAAPAKPAPAAVEAPVIHAVGVPAYHNELPKGALPEALPPSQFRDPRVQAAYTMAAQVRGVLYQQPCYCHCDQEVGHHSLLDCFAGDHASICETCMMEGVYAYQQTKAGKTPGQIRAAIERGEWKNVNLNELLVPRVY
ncbi:MAG: CYCXC family (seleno)protein [Terriglobales bacterium]